MNLLIETIDKLKEKGLTPDNVLWVGNYEVKTDWENFAKIANKEYDSGYGGQEIASDLLIVGKDWWLERHEYDGSEWWEFKQLPKEPKTKVELLHVDGDNMWSTLLELKSYK